MDKLNKLTPVQELERRDLVELIRCTDFIPTKGSVATIGSKFSPESIESIADNLFAKGIIPVVRCKDCIHWKYVSHPIYCSEPYGNCTVEINPCIRSESDFCSYGERKIPK